jgi:excinuclease ABC subunit B
MYADFNTGSMEKAVYETNRRRDIQKFYNKMHRITPASIEKDITSIFESVYESDYVTVNTLKEPTVEYESVEDMDDLIAELEKEMHEAARTLDFERAAELRDRIKVLKQKFVFEI